MEVVSFVAGLILLIAPVATPVHTDTAPTVDPAAPVEAPVGELGLEPGPTPPPPAPLPPPLPSALPVEFPDSGQSPGGTHAFYPLFTALAVAGVVGRRKRAAPVHSQIGHALRDNLIDDVSRRDLLRVSAQFRPLSVDETRLVIAQMSDRQLAVWLREMDGWRGSLSPAEEKEIFDRVVPRLDVSGVVRLVLMGGKAAAVLAAVETAPPAVQEGVVRALSSLPGPVANVPFAVADVLTGLSDESFARAVDAAGFGGLVAGLSRPRSVASPFGVPGHVTEVFDLGPLAHVAARASLVADPVVRARVFVELEGRIEQISLRTGIDTSVAFLSGSQEKALIGIGSLLDSHSVGRLNHQYDINGDHLSGWVRAMIDAGQYRKLGDLIGRMRGADHLAHFTVPGSEAAPYPNASNLGFVIGAHHRAITDITSDARKQIELVAKLAGLLTAYVPKPGKLRLPGGRVIDAHRDAVVGEMEAEARTTKQALWALGKPRNPDGSLWNGPGTTEYQNAWEEVVEVR